MRIHLIRIGLLVFYISALVSALSSSTNVPPEDLDTSGDDAEFSGSGSGSGDYAGGNDNEGSVTPTNVKKSWTTDAPPITVQHTTEKIPMIVLNKSDVSASLSPVTTRIPPMKTSDSDTLAHHTTNIPTHDIVEVLQTTTPSAEMVDITAAPVAEEVTTLSALDITHEPVVEVTTEGNAHVYMIDKSTTALVSGTEEEVTDVTTTVEEEVEGTTTTTTAATTTTTAAAVIVEDEDETSVPEVSTDEATDMPSLASTTTSSAPIKDMDMPPLASITTPPAPIKYTDMPPEASITTSSAPIKDMDMPPEASITTPSAPIKDMDMPPEASITTTSAPIGNTDDDLFMDNIIPEVRRGVDRPVIVEDNANNVGRSSESSSEHQTLLDRKEVLAGVICGGVVGLALAVMLVSIMAYRMKKKDEGSYALDDPKPFNGDYQIVKRQEEFLA